MSVQKSLQEDVERIDGNVNGLFAKVSELADRVDELEEENERLRSELEDAKNDAELALAVAGETSDQARADGGEPTKVKRAELLSRNEVVRQAAATTGKGGSVTAGDVVDEPSGAHLQVASAKGGHHREPPLATSIEDTMSAYVDVAEVDATDAVVDVSKRTVERWVDRAAAARGHATGDGSWGYVTPHDLRRSWATLLFEAGVEPGMVMEWGGWRDCATFRDHYLGEFSPAAVSRERDKVGWL